MSSGMLRAETRFLAVAWVSLRVSDKDSSSLW